MSIYLLPPAISDKDIVEVTKKAGVPFEVFSSLRELIFAEDKGPIVIGTISAQDLLVLNRHASTLVTELPTVIMAAPGVAYTSDWISLASALPPMDWREMQTKLAKSGHLAVQPEQLEKRGLGGAVFDQMSATSSLRKRHSPGEPTEPVGFEDLENVETDA